MLKIRLVRDVFFFLSARDSLKMYGRVEQIASRIAVPCQCPVTALSLYFYSNVPNTEFVAVVGMLRKKIKYPF